MTTDNSLLQAALAYASCGWPVFPCKPQRETICAALNSSTRPFVDELPSPQAFVRKGFGSLASKWTGFPYIAH
jgi:hypothetical protein